MRRKKKEKIKYSARYEGDKLNLELEKINLQIDLMDHLEVGFFLSKFREAGLGSSRDLGSLFRRSPTTVINKERISRDGSKGLIDDRRQNKGYKIDEIRGDILYIWAKNPLACDREILEGLKMRISSLGMSLDLKTLTRFTKEIGIDDARNRLRIEGRLATKEETLPDKNDNGNDSATIGKDDKEIIQGYSRYAGHMLHLGQLYQMDYLEMMEVLTEPEWCVYSKERIGHILYLLYASGGKRLYDLDYLDHRGLGVLIGMEDNIRSSGMNKRVGKIVNADIIESFQKKALEGRISLINRKDLELVYTDTHVVEVYVNKFIPMARHGTKNKQVKAINVHYLIGSDTGTPLAKEWTSGNKRLHWAIPHLVKIAEETLLKKMRKIGIICFDKGGISLNTLKWLIKEGKGFISWGKRAEYMKKQIKRLKEYRFRYRRKKEIRHDGKKILVEEKIADTTTYLNGIGKVRTIVVQLPEIEGGERLWIHTNLGRNRYTAKELRDMMRYKVRQEIFFKVRKKKSAIDCFGGGRCRVKAIIRPSKKVLELLKKQFRRLERKIEKERENLSDVKELKRCGAINSDIAKREIDYLIKRIKQNIEQKEKTEENIRWAEGGDRPEFIKQRYELELGKQKLLNEFQDLALLSKRESLKEFLNCYEEVLERDKLPHEEIKQRMKYIDRPAIEKELFSLGGFVTCDKKEKKITIMFVPQGREYFRKALEIFLLKQNKKKVVVQYSSKERYQLHFYLTSPPISAN